MSPRLLLIVISLTVVGLLVLNALHLSTTVDEPAHYSSGRAAVEGFGARFYRVNPPLARVIAVLPTWAFAPPLVDVESCYFQKRGEFNLGASYLRAHGKRADWSIRLSRLSMIPIALVGLLSVYYLAARLFGERAGLVAALLWAFSPELIGHSALITPDATAASLGMTTFAMFDVFCQKPNALNLWMLGAITGLTMLSKITWFLAPLILSTLVAASFLSKTSYPTNAKRLFLSFIGAMLVALATLNCGYLFEGSMLPLKEFSFSSHLMKWVAMQDRPDLEITSVVRNIPIPLPREYLIGLDEQQCDFDAAPRSYLRGEWRRGGWYHYYAYFYLIKTTIPMLLVLAAAVFSLVVKRDRSLSLSRELSLILPPLLIFVLASLQTGMNHHGRYILPAIPFLIVFASRLTCSWVILNGRVCQFIFICLLGWHAFEGIRYSPNQLSYFNQFAGGPANGSLHLVDSNIDWGQNLPQLRKFCLDNQISRIRLAYFGSVDSAIYGIMSDPIPFANSNRIMQTPAQDRLPPGWYAVSVSLLRGRAAVAPGAINACDVPADENDLCYFQRIKPVGRAGYSILIYHLTADDLKGLPVSDQCPE